MVAQQLYEGVEIKGKGTVGLVSYIRTDSVRISDEAREAVNAYVKTGSTTHQNHPQVTLLTLANMKGNIALGNMSALFAEAASGAWYVMTDETPSLMAFADAAKKANLKAPCPTLCR